MAPKKERKPSRLWVAALDNVLSVDDISRGDSIKGRRSTDHGSISNDKSPALYQTTVWQPEKYIQEGKKPQEYAEAKETVIYG